MVNSLVPLLNLFVHYFSNESSKSLNKLQNHPNMFMLEFYNGVKGCINKAFLRNRKILLYMKNHVYCICKAWPSFCHLPNLSQLTCGHFAGTNQNGRNKQGSRKNSVTVICKTHFLQSHAICLRVLDCRKISACRCLRAYEKSDKVLLFFSNVKTSERPCEFKGTK